MIGSGIVTADRAMLDELQRDTFTYFIRQGSPGNGLVADSTDPGSPASTAATGIGLSTHCVAAHQGWVSRESAVARTLATFRFLDASPQGPEPDASGYHGLYYHFLDRSTGRRASQSELSTIDTALLMAGVLTASAYFDGASDEEQEVRALGDRLYRRVDWSWATNGAATLCHGWTPEHGFLESSWSKGYSEAMLLYVLALGSPTFPVEPRGFLEWTRSFERKTVYGLDYFYAGPLFIHQLPQMWLDLRGKYDEASHEAGWDYFENSRRATLVHQRYAVENPRGFALYSRNAWGLTACVGPGPAVRVVDGVERKFEGYLARGAPFGPDDGTLSPWAVVASVPFASDIVCEAIHHAVNRLGLRSTRGGGLEASFNPTFPDRTRNALGWVSPGRFGLHEGPMVLMIENCLSGLVWKTFARSPYVVEGLRRAGFR